MLMVSSDDDDEVITESYEKMKKGISSVWYCNLLFFYFPGWNCIVLVRSIASFPKQGYTKTLSIMNDMN